MVIIKMVILNVLSILLLFETRMTKGRAYNCYISIPCPITMPCSEPSWDHKSSIQNMLMKCGESKTESPCPLPEPWCCPPYWETNERWQSYPSCRQLCPRSNQKRDFKTKKIVGTLLTLPGYLADTFLKGEIVL